METQKYNVILITAPTGEVFVCMRSTDRMRFLNCKTLFYYNSKVFKDLLEEFWWFQFKKDIVGENLSKKEAENLVWEWCQFCKLNGVLLNKRIPVPVELNERRNAEYQRRWRKTHRKEYNRKRLNYYYAHQEEMCRRQREYNRRKKAGKEGL